MTRLRLLVWLTALPILLMAIAACDDTLASATEDAQDEFSPEIAVAPPTSTPTQPVEIGGQNLKFEHISSADGLSQNTANCILQDSYGFIWIGTEQGLNKYDGYRFTTYKHDPDNPNSLSNNRIWTIYEDQSGVLWIGTFGGGLNRFDRATEQFTRYDADDFQNETDEPVEYRNVIWAIDENPTGVLWIATYGGGLVKFVLETEEFTSYAPDPDNPNYWGHEWITALLIDSSGILWLGTDSEGLDRFEPNTGVITSFRHNPDDAASLGHDRVTAIIEDQSGSLWIGTQGGGLDRYDRKNGVFAHYRHDPADPDSLGDDHVQRILESTSGTLWIGLSDDGLDALDRDSETFIHYQGEPAVPYSLSSNRSRSLYEDRSGALWVGTVGGGVNRADPASRQFTFYPGDPTISGNKLVLSIYEDSEGLLWVGTSGEGLDILDRNSGERWHYQHDADDPNSLGNNYVLAIHEDASGVFWIGTVEGLFQFDRESEQFSRLPHNPPDPWDVKRETIYSIYEDRDGTLWFATHGRGLSEWRPDARRFIYHQQTGPDSSSDFVQVFLEDRSGKLWVGTEGGLTYLDRPTGVWHFYKHDVNDPNSLSHNWVSSVHEDRAGTLWVGTFGGGLNRFDPQRETFIHYGEKDRLASDQISGILEDDRGFLWLGTANGLSKFDPRNETFTNHGADRGLPVTNFDVALKSPSGEMFFGGINGFISFFPDQIRENSYLPPVFLTSLQQRGQKLNLGIAPEDTKEIVLRWPDNSFEFEFAALSFSQPERNQYAYMLEGFDEEWLFSQSGRYTNLPGGAYELRLKGSNNDGVWNETGRSIEVIVVPPFWETLWFRGALVLILVAAGFGAYRLRVSGLEARSQELERQVEDRTAALADANIRLFQEIEERERAEEELAQQRAEAAVAEERNRLARDLHDSVTQSIYSLTLLSEAGKRMAEAKDLDQLATNQSRIGDISQQALQEMRLLVYELRPPALETEGLVGALEHRLEIVEKRAGIDARLIVEGDPKLPADLEEELYRITQEALNNALKHAQASTVLVLLRVDAKSVSLQVQDDGRGFEPEAARVSGGLGLATMAERAERIGGQLTIQSTPNEGTVVKVKVHQ